MMRVDHKLWQTNHIADAREATRRNRSLVRTILYFPRSPVFFNGDGFSKVMYGSDPQVTLL
jgi:hypothetical protein